MDDEPGWFQHLHDEETPEDQRFNTHQPFKDVSTHVHEEGPRENREPTSILTKIENRLAEAVKQTQLQTKILKKLVEGPMSPHDQPMNTFLDNDLIMIRNKPSSTRMDPNCRDCERLEVKMELLENRLKKVEEQI